MESSSTRDLALRRALIDHAFDQGRGGVLLNTVGVLGVSWFHSIVAGSHIDPRWLAAMLTIIVFRMWTIWNAPRLREGRSVVFAERLYSVPMMLMAALWFMLPWQLLPAADADEMLVLLMVQAGLASGAASMLAAFRWPARFYIACQLLPSVILLFGFHSHGPLLSLLGLAYMAIMLFSHARARDSLVTAQTRLLDNLSLLDEARQQQKLVEDLNRDLVAARDAMRAQNLGLERLVAERTERIRLASVAIEHIAAGLMVTDAEGRVVEVNPAFSEITGYAAGQMLGRPASQLESDRHEPEFYRQMWAAARDSGRWDGEVWSRRADGGLFLERRSIDAVPGDDGRVSHYVFVINDITESHEKDERIRFLAFHDALTGLPNRFLLEDRLRHGIETARRERQQLGLMFLDLDQFKAINDGLGHDVGDLLLKEVAARIKGELRQCDTVARLGGDEFVVLVRGLRDQGHYEALMSKLIETISQPLTVLSHRLNVGTSLGVAIYPQDGQDPATLMRNADLAMYAAKAGGRGMYRFFEAGMSQSAVIRLELETALRQAQRQGELSLHYQPKTAALSGEVVGYEALMRWFNPQRGHVSPASFIPVAEESGLIGQLGRWSLGEAARQIAAWQAAGFGWQRVAVNVSARQLVEGDLAGEIRQACVGAGIPPELIEIELTESVLMNQPGEAARALQAVKALGVTVAIDDFGTGYSSLAYLRRLPIDVLKIDRSFVQEAELDEHGMAIIRTVLVLARTLDLRVVAEGVETEVQAGLLREAGCEFLQGYLFGRPEPAEKVEARWAAARPTRGATPEIPVS